MRQVKSDTTLVGISELRTQADAIVKVAQRGPVVLEKHHKPIAVLVPIEQWRRPGGARKATIVDVLLGPGPAFDDGIPIPPRSKWRIRKPPKF